MPRSLRQRKRSTTTTSRPKPKPHPDPDTDSADDDDGPIYFWKPHETPHGIFSQWYESPFTAPTPCGTSTQTYTSAEQFMMHRKALLFDDAAIAAEVLATRDPGVQRSLGRAVKGFDEAVWVANRSRIVEEGSYWKFLAEPGPLLLLATGCRELVEASPRDRVWGVGRGAERARVEGREGRRERWGLNLLGKALMAARERIRAEGVGVGVGVGEKVSEDV